jgi:DNA helicase-2/ATP-dependent DNA helicase PcrA
VPTRVPASRFKDYVDDPDAVAAELARPMPQRPYRATRIGTLFHSWVEERSGGSDARPAGPVAGQGSAGAAADLDGLDFELDDATRPDELIDDPVDARLDRLRATFAASEWGDRRPVAVELELHLPLDDHVFVCKLDAVYDVDAGSELGVRGIRAQVVDWKTGGAPRDARELELRQTQLALYRLAYARWSGLPPEQIDAVFYYVEDDLVLRPEELYDETGLRRAWAGVAARTGAARARRTQGEETSSVPEEMRTAIARP